MHRSVLFLYLFCPTVTWALAPALVHTAVGAIAGSTGAIAAYPIDYVKSQLQTEEGREKYEGGFDAALDIVRNGGPFALYRGLMVNVVGVAPEKTVKLGANAMVRGMLMAQLGYLPLAGEVFAGGFAGATQVIVTNPLEVVKLKIQTSQMGAKEVLSQLHGLADLYQGAGACVARDVVFSAVLFPLYAHTKVAFAAALVGICPPETVTFWANLLAGSIAAGPAAMISTPADVVKTRLQQARASPPPMKVGTPLTESSSSNNNLPSNNRGSPVPLRAASSSSQLSMAKNTVGVVEDEEKASMFQVMNDIATKEGPDVLFSGWAERVVRSVPQFGVTLAVFDLLNNYAINQGWLLEQIAN
ncbi:Mitochondrial aspartate-glutamate transporter AGC1 [Seminavis robusta]|uniref:Mitochondrial aspartate-glutamate transporter AGC1 n=1 Tax=Seminavis robusta TaxID=568900 RepID=A0A9N8H8C4_9STRA|nr:Mitochondrial aspartate-glutamate transporter AGC1 [Seminavis robusta]|eukprot:Sro235_g094710.1 Mitochondrial aspartate-glutamate transporter AGC1 (358) ;mRNA; r:42660-43733